MGYTEKSPAYRFQKSLTSIQYKILKILTFLSFHHAFHSSLQSLKVPNNFADKEAKPLTHITDLLLGMKVYRMEGRREKLNMGLVAHIRTLKRGRDRAQK